MKRKNHQPIPLDSSRPAAGRRFFKSYWWIILLILLQIPAVNFALHTPFALIDDYRESLFIINFSSWHNFIQREKNAITTFTTPRFRPMQNVFRLGNYGILGNNPRLHHILMLLMKVAIAFFSCKCLRLIFRGKPAFRASIAVFLSLFLFYPNNPEARLCVPELYLVLFFSIHIFFMYRMFYSRNKGTVSFLLNYIFLLLSYILFMWSKETSITFGFVSICFLLIFARSWKHFVLIVPFAVVFAHLTAKIISIKNMAGYGTAPITIDLILKNALFYRKTVFLWNTSIWIAFFLVAGVLTLIFLTVRKLWIIRQRGINSVPEAIRHNPRVAFALLLLANFVGCFGFTFLFWIKVLRYAYPAGYLLLMLVAVSSGWIAEVYYRKAGSKTIISGGKRSWSIRLCGVIIFVICSYYVLVNYHNFLAQYVVQHVVRSNEKRLLDKTYQLLKKGKRVCVIGEGESFNNLTNYFRNFLPYYHGTRRFEIMRVTREKFDRRIRKEESNLRSKDLYFIALLLRNEQPILPNAIAKFDPKRFDELWFPMPWAERISAWLQGRNKPYYQKDAGCSHKDRPRYWEIYENPIATPLDESVLLQQIARTDDIINLFRLKDEYRCRGGKSQAIIEALKNRWEEFLEKHPPPGTICPEADLIAFDYKKVGDAQYRADFLYKVNQPFNQDYKISLYGIVDKSNLDLLSKGMKKSKVWHFRPAIPTTAWPVGEYILISHTLSAQPIPYKMCTYLYDPTKKGSLHGQRIDLGWCTTGITEDELISQIESCGDLFNLYRLQTWNQNWLKKSETVREACEKKSRQLLEGVEPLGQICPEAELVAFDYRKIGDNQYRIDYLFRVLAPLEADYTIFLYGVVDENNRHLLSESRRRRGKKSEAWSSGPDPSTRDWSEGEYVFISNVIEAQPIPYNMYTILYDREGRCAHGQRVDLGWRVNLGESTPDIQ